MKRISLLFEWPLMTIIVIMIVGGVVSCSKEQGEPQTKTFEVNGVSRPYHVVTIEGCQYVWFESLSYRAGLAHKGNCTNVIHRADHVSVYVQENSPSLSDKIKSALGKE